MVPRSVNLDSSQFIDTFPPNPQKTESASAKQPHKTSTTKITINQYFIAHRMRRFPINQPVKNSLIELNVVWPITGQFLLHFRVASFHDFCN
jgi:hypothetical protein